MCTATNSQLSDWFIYVCDWSVNEVLDPAAPLWRRAFPSSGSSQSQSSNWLLDCHRPCVLRSGCRSTSLPTLNTREEPWILNVRNTVRSSAVIWDCTVHLRLVSSLLEWTLLCFRINCASFGVFKASRRWLWAVSSSQRSDRCWTSENTRGQWLWERDDSGEGEEEVSLACVYCPSKFYWATSEWRTRCTSSFTVSMFV